MLSGFGGGFNFIYSSGFSAGTVITVTPGASFAEGNWVQLASGANLSKDIYMITLQFSGYNAQAANRHAAIDLGIDPAGGTSYTEVMQDFTISNMLGTGAGGLGHSYLFPYFIKAGSSVALRAKSNVAAGPTFLVAARFFGQPVRPERIRAGTYFTATGAISSGTIGVAFVPPNNATLGTWVSLGTLAKPAWWHQLGFVWNSTTMTTGTLFIDVAHGDATNKKHIIEKKWYSCYVDEYMSVEQNLVDCYCDLPAGAEIWVRGGFNVAFSASTFYARLMSVGGG